jgi:uncharacterized protein (TIGR00730 family)
MPKQEARKRRRYSTGVEELDESIAQLVAETGITERDGRLIAEIVTTAFLLGRDFAARALPDTPARLDPEDLKIVNAALKEMRYAFKVFAPYRDVKKVSVFGSARTKPGDPDYEQAREFGKLIAEHGWMVVTGAGPGSMEAANEGAGAAKSFGVNIRLPFEAEPNPVVADDPKLINFKYFFTRKLMFIKEASAFVLLPGGFGTMDEAFELLTLMQTGKSPMHPIVLLDAPGGTYWKSFVEFTRRELIDKGYVSPPDLNLFTLTDSVEEAAKEIADFYTNYDSMRFVGNRLVLRVQHAPDDEALARLSRDFADVADGAIERTDPLPVEIADDDELDKQRIVLRFDRASYGRLRDLIDELNRLPLPPPQPAAAPAPAAPDGEAATA